MIQLLGIRMKKDQHRKEKMTKSKERKHDDTKKGRE